MTLKRLFKRLFKRMIGNWWEVRVCYFPYPEGYATFNRFKNTVLDTELSKEEAQRRCDVMNND